jgi:hypothetical protein
MDLSFGSLGEAAERAMEEGAVACCGGGADGTGCGRRGSGMRGTIQSVEGRSLAARLKLLVRRSHQRTDDGDFIPLNPFLVVENILIPKERRACHSSTQPT